MTRADDSAPDPAAFPPADPGRAPAGRGRRSSAMALVAAGLLGGAVLGLSGVSWAVDETTDGITGTVRSSAVDEDCPEGAGGRRGPGAPAPAPAPAPADGTDGGSAPSTTTSEGDGAAQV